MYLFFTALLVYGGYLVWACNTKADPEITAALARAARGEVDPDDLTDAHTFAARQARTAAAIRGQK